MRKVSGYQSLASRIHRPRGFWHYAWVIIAPVFLLGASGSDASRSNVATPLSQPAAVQTTNVRPVQPAEVKTPVTVTKMVEEKSDVAFAERTQNDGGLQKGAQKVTQSGKNGVRTKTFAVTYTDGSETSRSLVSDVVTTPSVDQVTAIGTYVAPPISSTTPSNGAGGSGYTNVDGNHVASPSSNPEGATARCRDGNYSYSQNHRGTCSSHGGVAEWY